MMALALKFLIAHILGDFVFQPDKWVRDKKIEKQRSVYLYLHLGVHVLALLVLLQFDWKYWPALLISVASHYLIDLTKLYLEGKMNTYVLFGLDQLAHLSVIAAIVYSYEAYHIDIETFYSLKGLITLLALLCVTHVSAIIMKLVMGQWPLDEDDSSSSLPQAGKYIGILERLFVFVFITLGQWQAIGLLIAAKSVFRFGDLSKAKDRKLTEYILIGTLISFGLAMTIGLGYQFAIKSWGS